jgi:hypothetical protein
VKPLVRPERESDSESRSVDAKKDSHGMPFRLAVQKRRADIRSPGFAASSAAGFWPAAGVLG